MHHANYVVDLMSRAPVVVGPETVAAAGQRGMPVYAVLEGYEMPQFERRFAGQLGSRVTFEPVDRVLTTYIAELRAR